MSFGRIAFVAAMILVMVAAPLAAIDAAPALAEEAGPPTFPSPEPWFDWGQRCINGVMMAPCPVPVASTYLMGYGNYYPDVIIDGQPYKINTTLDPFMNVSYRAYLRSEGGPEELHWYMRGSETATTTTVFDDDLINFEYPLYLGKTWSDATATPHPDYGTLAVTTSAVAVAYIEPVLDGDGNVQTCNVVVADGCSYQLPDLNSNGVLGDDVGAVPLPRRELGDISWEAMKTTRDDDAQVGWDDVVVPAGPHQGESMPGYYVVKQTITTTATIYGYPVKVAETVMEAWKDVRGCVAVQIVTNGQQTASGWVSQTSMTVASRWTGNFPWYQYEFGGHGQTFAVRVKDTAIGEGGHTFQFTTPEKDFGCKHAGDAMKVFRKPGLITIDYEDDYITCQGALKRVKGGSWYGAATIEDLATGRTYVVFGLA